MKDNFLKIYPNFSSNASIDLGHCRPKMSHNKKAGCSSLNDDDVLIFLLLLIYLQEQWEEEEELVPTKTTLLHNKQTLELKSNLQHRVLLSITTNQIHCNSPWAWSKYWFLRISVANFCYFYVLRFGNFRFGCSLISRKRWQH